MGAPPYLFEAELFVASVRPCTCATWVPPSGQKVTASLLLVAGVGPAVGGAGVLLPLLLLLLVELALVPTTNTITTIRTSLRIAASRHRFNIISYNSHICVRLNNNNNRHRSARSRAWTLLFLGSAPSDHGLMAASVPLQSVLGMHCVSMAFCATDAPTAYTMATSTSLTGSTSLDVNQAHRKTLNSFHVDACYAIGMLQIRG